MVKLTSYEAPQHVVFSSLSSFPPSQDQTFSSAPCPDTYKLL